MPPGTVVSGLIDFHADELWQRSRIKPAAAE